METTGTIIINEQDMVKIHLYSATVLDVFDPTQSHRQPTELRILEDWTAVGSRPYSAAAHIVNSVKILPNSILT